MKLREWLKTPKGQRAFLCFFGLLFLAFSCFNLATAVRGGITPFEQLTGKGVPVWLSTGCFAAGEGVAGIASFLLITGRSWAVLPGMVAAIILNTGLRPPFLHQPVMPFMWWVGAAAILVSVGLLLLGLAGGLNGVVKSPSDRP